jgi:hypothetical protein
MRRKRLSIAVVLAVAALALSSTGKAIAQDGSGEHVGALAVLYDQTDNAHATHNATSQNFTDLPDSYDTFAADDFVVPANTSWVITSVEVTGVYDGDPSATHTASSVNVWFYGNSGTLPAATPMYAATEVIPSAGISTGSFIIPLSSPPTLGAGVYWLSVQANMAYTGPDTRTRQWLWRERTVQSNNPSAWKNPGGDAGGGLCLTWGVLDGACLLPAENHDPDLLFKLSGSTLTLNHHLYLPLTVRGP